MTESTLYSVLYVVSVRAFNSTLYELCGSMMIGRNTGVNVVKKHLNAICHGDPHNYRLPDPEV